jgi:hypothetical protein
MRPTSRSLVLAGLLLAACGGGGGGGGGGSAVTLLAATFSGAGATPAAGDALILFFTGDVALAAGAVLTDADVTFAGGGSLGAPAVPPTQLSGRAIAITLGPGVSFGPGATQVDLSAANDVVLAAGGARAAAGAPRTIQRGDGGAPPLVHLTANQVQDSLNGRGAAGGTLQVPQAGFTIDVTASDASGIDAGRTVLFANVDVGSAIGTIRAGASLVPALTASLAGGTQTFLVPGTTVFPAGPVTLTAYVFDATGMPSTERTFAFRTIAANDALRPFEPTAAAAAQVWFLDVSRDVESYTFVGGGGQTVTVTAGANGRPDLFDLFLILGLHGGDAAVNDTVTGSFRANVLLQLGLLYSGANVQFTFTPPGTFPGGAQVPYGSHGFSQISIAGAENGTGSSGILGVALLDPNNQNQDNDTLVDFGGSQRLGVFVHTIVNLGMRPPAGSLFRSTYDPFAPGTGGTPIGNDAGDAARLVSPSDARGTAIASAIGRLARFVAVVAAHECGHSVGLVANGAMPAGLYGGLPAFFPGSTSGHIQMADFPSGAQNVMAPGIDFGAAQSANTGFNPLNRAYLLERALYDFVP